MGDIVEGMDNDEDTRQLAVVSILFDIDGDNAAFDAIFDVDVQYADTSDIVFGLDLNDLMPADIASAGYFAYEGALTSPPCSDIVRYFVMNTMGTIGASQLQKFRELLDKFGDSLSPNFKEVQNTGVSVFGCVGYLDGGNDEVVEAVIPQTDSEHNIGWIVLVFAMMFGAIVMVCCIARKCETVTHKPLTTEKKKDNKSFIERKVYGVITTAGVKDVVEKETADV